VPQTKEKERMTKKLTKILMGLAAIAALALGGSALAGAQSGGGSNAQTVQEQGEASEPGGAENSATDTDNVQDENGKDDAQEGDTGGKDDEGDQKLTGDTATKAAAAAEAKTGGKAGQMERDTEKGATYEVEVTKTDGSKVDVRLDDQFKVVAVDSDSE
jgi:uncharacterized membrane protein YkoI